MSSKKKSRKKEPCPYPRCVLKAEHGGEHAVEKAKGGRPGSKWTPKLRAFVEALKSGKQQTEACRIAYPSGKNHDVQASKLMKNPLVIEAMTEHAKIQRAAEEKAAFAQAKKTAISKSSVAERLWELANYPSILTNGTINGQVRAAQVLTEVLGMKIGAQNPDKFEGFTDRELEQYAKDGTVPERFAIRFGITPGGPSQVM